MWFGTGYGQNHNMDNLIALRICRLSGLKMLESGDLAAK